MGGIGGGKNSRTRREPAGWAGKADGSLDFELEPNRPISQANRAIADGDNLTRPGSNRKNWLMQGYGR